MFDLIATILAWFYDLFPSYGVSITLLTVLIMIILTPLTLKQTRSMIKMQHIQPELKKIQNQYKNDKERMNKEVMAFYQANDVNPMSGCLPLFVQAPVFLVLYNVIRGLTRRLSGLGEHVGWVMGKSDETLFLSSKELGVFYPDYLDQQSNLFKNLSQETEMVSWGIDLSRSASKALSDGFIQSFPYFLLILGVFASSWYQQKQIRGRNQQVSISPQQQMIFKIMPFFLPVISYSFDAALVVYFLISNLYRIAQQGYITRKFYGSASERTEPIKAKVSLDENKKSEKNDSLKPNKTENKSRQSYNSTSEALSKRTTAGNNENNSQNTKNVAESRESKQKSPKKLVADSNKTEKKRRKKTGNTKKNKQNENINSRTQSGRVTPQGTNASKSQKKRKKKRK